VEYWDWKKKEVECLKLTVIQLLDEVNFTVIALAPKQED
jgi:hypothetical protein